jgi:hypothetical protein
MASPFQQQALRRKLIYIGLIVLLFTVAGVFRITVVEAKAEALSLREQNVGEVEVGGSALQLSLTGSRGFVVCVLWNWAIEAQKKNRWNELELHVDLLTRLQPHFFSPWLFQSWNLAYNVSVEADQVKDKYFYVYRGVQLLEKGERKNHCNPDMRFSIGFYQQHKVMQSDETNVFRCLYQMSSIPPPQRDPDLLMPVGPDGKRALDRAQFEKFCVEHPQLVRRLHDKLRCNRPEDVVRFLEENKHIPTIYVDDENEARPEWSQGRYPLKPVADRFPALPPPLDVRESERARDTPIYDATEVDYNTLPGDSFDAFAASRAWSGYAQEALPPPSRELPGESAEITDRLRQRKSKMTVNLFRNHPPRSQSYIGERLQDEGWFGPEGWLITDWFPGSKFLDGQPAVVGTGTHWASATWSKAYDLWEKRGKASLMLLDLQTLEEKKASARAVLEPLGLEDGRMPPRPEPEPDDPKYKSWKDGQFMFQYEYSRRLTNFPHFLYRSLVEMTPEMIQARRTMFDARLAVRRGRRAQAEDYFKSKTGLALLRQILENNPDFQQDHFMQEELYELELRYVKLMQDKEGGTYKQLMACGHLLGTVASAGPWTAEPTLYYPVYVVTQQSARSNLPVPEFVPEERMQLEAPGKDGKPLIDANIQMQVKVRHGLMKAPEMTPEQMGMAGRPIMPGNPNVVPPTEGPPQR